YSCRGHSVPTGDATHRHTSSASSSAYIVICDEQVLQMQIFFRYWDILRLCCGPQQSQVHLQQLQGGDLSRDPMAADYPACEMYNISQVEHLALLVEKSIGVRGLLELPKVGYCACFNQMTSSYPQQQRAIIKECGDWH
ncbi:hypothetical protein B484DRAFT_433897, partial [Ochromonadaceae sp. CCMP2298]